METLKFPFGDVAPALSDSELRETAYEILIAACRSSVARPLTFISQSDRFERGATTTTAAAPSLQRSLTSTAASKVKKALGMKSGKKGAAKSTAQEKKAVTIGELFRVQMRVSEQIDSRIRKALLRIAAGQLGKRMESVVLPLEFLQQLKPSDFTDHQEYEAWRVRNLKLLEAGLLLHPHFPPSKTEISAQFRQTIRAALQKLPETGSNTAQMQALRNAVMSLACRSVDGLVSEKSHWADGFPFNLRLYQLLLEACFDIHDEPTMIEEVDEVLELVRKTWIILGIDTPFHNICFLWVLFLRYVSSGEVENDLLLAANNLIGEVEKDVKGVKDHGYSKVISAVLSSILDWSEKKLRCYHDMFNSDNIESMEFIVSLGVSAAKIMVEDISYEYQRKKKQTDVARDRVDTYIRSSLRTAFGQIKKMIEHNKRLSKNQHNQLPFLSVLSEDIVLLAFNEKAIFSPILKKWHPLAAGVAVATLHSCYGSELKKFVSGVNELTPDAIKVLTSADKLEKDLLQIVVQDAVDSDDGGKSIIREMPPYEAESVIGNLVSSWIKTRVDRLKEWVDRTLQQEGWNPSSNKQRVAVSSVEVLRFIDETLEAFFLLPILSHSALLPELTSGIDKCLQHYISKLKSGCGTRNSFLPKLPALTRCTTVSKLMFRRKEKPHVGQRRKSLTGSVKGNDSLGILQLCCRINSLQHIHMELEVLQKKIVGHLQKSETHYRNVNTPIECKTFEVSFGLCVQGMKQLCEATAYKVVFRDLSHVLWDGLYVREVSSSRMEPFLQELDQYLEIISSTVHDKVRTRVITDLMKASFEGFLLVLLAGGPSRAFTCQDSEAIEEDFKFLRDLFWSNGDGLPLDLVEKYAMTLRSILPLFSTDTESIIDRFKSVSLEAYGPSVKNRLALPPTTGQWNPTEPNTLMRVLCYRNDEMATKFLKKTYNLPRKLS